MWTADDLSEGDYVVCEDENDRSRMYLALRREDVLTVSDSKFINGKQRPALRVTKIRCHKGYESEDYDKKM